VPKILVIDDSKVIRSLLLAELEGRGYEVATAEDGMEGLTKAATTRYDLILIDAMMPGVGGFEVCRKLAETRVDGKPRLVMFSNRTKDFQARQQASTSGADAFVTKQSPARLADELGQLLN
jgi:two-component system OmpR family response regulator